MFINAIALLLVMPLTNSEASHPVAEMQFTPGLVSTTAKLAPSPIDEVDWNRNIGELVLDVESALFSDWVLASTRKMSRVEDGYRILGELRIAARERLRSLYTSPSETGLQLESLELIHDLLNERGFTYKDYQAQSTRMLGHHTLSFGLARKELDCSMYTVVYLAIAEDLGLPLSGISMPEHLAVRWAHADGTYTNWETTVGKVATDEFYRRWKSLDETQTDPGVYLRSLSKAEVLATAFGEKALLLLNRGAVPAAQVAAQCAVQLAPLSPDNQNLRGLVARKCGDLSLAMASFEKAITLDPTFSHVHFNLGNCALESGDLALAHVMAKRLERLDGGLAQRLQIAIGTVLASKE